ncbi:MAG: UDP-glucose/GDP-mannose dehydrogenase family protein [Rectinemataceae bacterium]
MGSIAVIGTGYVGLVSGACLADFGNTVTCVDVDEKKIERLHAGEIPIFEPGLSDVVARNVAAKRLTFTTDSAKAIQDSEVIFIAVGTPPSDDGSADLRYVEEAARTIGRTIGSYRVVVDKSTVPIGTGRLVKKWVAEELDARALSHEFDVVSNPEFLREGSAVYDFMHPDRVVLGIESDKAREAMRAIYRVLYLNETPFIETNLESAEMIKYASNAFLAVKITFINEIANLCEKVGADVKAVATAMGKDGRIGAKFLHAGPGYGGSCFPKDTKALADIARKNKSPLKVVEATILANEAQKLRMVDKIEEALGSLKGKKLAVLGLAFKPNTDDMREAPALAILAALVSGGARIKAYDPEAMEEASWRLQAIDDHVTYCAGEYDTMKDADALVILTEWNQFRNLDLAKVKRLLKTPVLFDFRNIYDRAQAEALGFAYIGVGR